MRRSFVLIAFFIAMTLLGGTIAAQTQPVVQVPMTPVAQWPPAVPNAPATANSPSAAAPTAPPEPNVNTSITPAQTLGIGNFSAGASAYGFTGDQPSLAEAAREARQRLAKDHPRMFTNDDVARLRRAAGEPPLGVSPAGPPATSEQTMPAGDQTAPSSAVPRTGSPNNPEGTQNNGVQTNAPASGQTTPPASDNQSPVKSSPFRPKQ